MRDGFMNINDSQQNNQKFVIDFFKLILILGVVSIHSNVLNNIKVPTDCVGYLIVELLSVKLTLICVPCFFILSGYLFFRNISHFNVTIYKNKLKSRFYSLILPYFLWNVIALILTIVKIEFLNFPSYGLIENHELSIFKLIEGFIDYTNGYPYAFAFWFIRNLIVFVVASPLVYLIIRKKWVIILLLIPMLILEIDLYGFEYFIIGAWLSVHFRNFQINGVMANTLLIIWLSIAISSLYIEYDNNAVVKFVSVICAFLSLPYIIRKYIEQIDNRLSQVMIKSTFYIYAFHQLYCTVTQKFYINIFGINTSLGIFLSYLLSFITLVGSSFILWLICKRWCPTVLKILGGNR